MSVLVNNGVLIDKVPLTGALKEHGNSEAGVAGTTQGAGTVYYYYSNVPSGGTIVSASITLSKKCMVVVVSLLVTNGTVKVSDIRRDGANKTLETTVLPANFGGVQNHYGFLQYATELLDAGTYTYSVVNTAANAINSYGAAIKIVAVEG